MGSSGGGNTTTTQEFKPPDYTQQSWQDYLNAAGNLTSQPQNTWQGETVAPWNGQQQQAANFIQDRALYGSPAQNAAEGAATDISNGAYLGQDPYMQQGTAFNGVASGGAIGSNPWLSQSTTNNAIQSTADQMTRAFQNGTAAQTDAQFAHAGAFGGSAYDQTQSMNAGNLAGQIGNMANQYQLGLTGLGTQDYQNSIAQMLQASGQGASDYNTGVNQMLQGAGLGGQLSQDDWTSANALMNLGNQQQTYQQNLDNSAYQQWQGQQNFPYQQLDAFGNALSRASGTGGTNSQIYGQNGLSTLLGGAGLLGSVMP